MRCYLLNLFVCLCLAGLSVAVQASYSSPEFEHLHDKLGIAPEEVFEESTYILQLATASQDIAQQLGALLLVANSSHILNQKEKNKEALQQGLALAEAQDNLSYQSSFTLLLAQISADQGDYSNALKLSDRAVSLARSTGDERIIAEALNTRGGIQLDMQNHQAALEDMLQAINLFKQNDDHQNTGVMLSNIGLIYLATEEHGQAIRYFLDSTKYVDKDDKYDMAITYINLGDAYLENQQYDEAEKYLALALEVAASGQNNMNTGHASFRMALLRIEQERFPEALRLMKKALPLFILQQDTLMQFNTRTSLSDLYIALADLQHDPENIRASARQLTEARKLQDVLKTPETELHLLQTQTDFYLATDDYKKTTEILKKQIKVLRDIHLQEKDSKLAVLKLQFHREQEQEQNQLLRDNNLLQEQTIKEQALRQRLQYVVILLLIALLWLIGRNMLKHRHQSGQMATLALSDELTGAPNRRNVLERGKQEMDRAKRHLLPLALAIIDLDHFKKINDTFGHQAGDDALIIFSQLCGESLRIHDLYGRYGGEEWLLICPHTKQKEVYKIVKRIHEQYAQASVPDIPDSHPLTFSAGISQLRSSDTHLEQIIQRADSALYQAKSQGRNQTVLYNSPQPSRT